MLLGKLRLLVLVALSLGVAATAQANLLTGPTNDLSGSGDIASAGMTESWLFLADPAGGSVTIVATPSSSLHLTEEIVDPLGDVIGEATSALPGQVVTLLEVTLPMKGIYTIIVSGNDNTTGTYQLSATGVEGASIHSLVVPEPGSIALVVLALIAGTAARSRRQPE
jgi:hypothetical protein